MMRLHYDETLSPRLACAVARHLALPVEFVRVRLRQGENKAPEFLALNLNGLVPVLQDGAQVIWETTAITMHLALRAGSALSPSEPERQVEVLRWSSWATDHFTRAGGALYFEYLIKPRIGLGAPDANAIAAATAEFRRFAAVLEAHLDGREWLLGAAPTLADLHVAAALPFADEARIPLHEFQRLARWYARLDAWPA